MGRTALEMDECHMLHKIPPEETMINRNRMHKVALAAGAMSLLLLLGLPATAEETGESLFKSKCAMCHGPDGAGKTKMGETLKIPDLHSADAQKKSDDELNTVIAKGKEKMPSYESKLSKEQIAKLVAFAKLVAYIREIQAKK
jgi:mono/diheme cytochrome c family protein